MYVTTIDARFLVKFYESYQREFVNARNFIQDTMGYKKTMINTSGMNMGGGVHGQFPAGQA